MITIFNEKIVIRFVIIILMFFLSCSCNKGNKGDIYVGNYLTTFDIYEKADKISIVKAGKSGYFVNVDMTYSSHSEYCKFEDDCFVYKEKSNSVPFVCAVDNNKLVLNDGTTFYRK